MVFPKFHHYAARILCKKFIFSVSKRITSPFHTLSYTNVTPFQNYLSPFLIYCSYSIYVHKYILWYLSLSGIGQKWSKPVPCFQNNEVITIGEKRKCYHQLLFNHFTEYYLAVDILTVNQQCDHHVNRCWQFIIRLIIK